MTSGGKQGVHTWVRETVSPDNLGEKSVKSWRLRGAVVALTWRYRGAYVALLWRCLGAVLAWSGLILWAGPNRGANVAWSWRLRGAVVALTWRCLGAYVVRSPRLRPDQPRLAPTTIPDSTPSRPRPWYDNADCTTTVPQQCHVSATT